MKIISKTSERNLLKKPKEPNYRPFSEWEEWDGTQGWTQAECERFIKEQTDADNGIRVERTGNGGVGHLSEWRIRTPYEIEICRIVADNFDVDSYNKALKE